MRGISGFSIGLAKGRKEQRSSSLRGEPLNWYLPGGGILITTAIGSPIAEAASGEVRARILHVQLTR